MKLIGFDRVCLDDSFRGFHLLYGILTFNWVKFYEEYMQFKLDFESCERTLGPDVLTTRNFKGEEIKENYKMYKQIYFEKEDVIVHEIYFVLDM